jgi:HSP20 family molecular chaperone IbpA
MEAKDLQSQDTRVAGAEPTRNRRVYTPKADIVETNDAIEVIADMPGVNEQSVSITLERGVLTVYGKVDWKEPESHDPVHREYGVGDYQRAFTLSDAIDQDRIEARVKNGVVRIKLPKGAGARVRQIVVKGN